MTDSTHLFAASRDRECFDARDTISYESNDGRSQGNTMMMPYQDNGLTKDQKSRYNYLAKLNDGMYEDSRGQENKKADQRRIVDVYGSELALSEYQIDRLKHIIANVSLMFGRYKYEKSILAFVTLVCDESGRHVRDEAEFNVLMQAMDVNSKQLRSLRKSAFQRMLDHDNIVVDRS